MTWFFFAVRITRSLRSVLEYEIVRRSPLLTLKKVLTISLRRAGTRGRGCVSFWGIQKKNWWWHKQSRNTLSAKKKTGEPNSETTSHCSTCFYQVLNVVYFFDGDWDLLDKRWVDRGDQSAIITPHKRWCQRLLLCPWYRPPLLVVERVWTEAEEKRRRIEGERVRRKEDRQRLYYQKSLKYIRHSGWCCHGWPSFVPIVSVVGRSSPGHR